MTASRIVSTMPGPQSLAATIDGTAIRTDTATIAALRTAMARGELTSATLTAFYLRRIEELNPVLHAVIAVNQHALAAARSSDAARTAGRPPGPLEGIPVLIKDNIETAELPATAGSPALQGAGCRDAFLVSRLRAAGAVILGKANLSEWANFRSTHSTSGWSTLGGQTANPWGEGRNPSGSSSGSAAAVAAGLAPLAVGTETDGSIISPAAACGVVGVKPTLGLISRSGIVPITAAQDTAGPMAGCVADAAVLLDALAGPDPEDPATSRAAGQPGGHPGSLRPGALAGARLGIWRGGCKAASPATVAVLDEAVDRLRGAGAEVIDDVGMPGADEIEEPELTAMRHEFAHDLNAYLGRLPGDHPVTLSELIEFNRQNAGRVLAHFGQELFIEAEATGGDLADPARVAARENAARLARGALEAALSGHRLDAVVTLAGGPAWLTDYLLGDHVVYSTTSPAAVSGYPALCVPAGRVGGLPVAVSFQGSPWSEARLLALAYGFEQAGAPG
jgi:amidase